MTAARRSASVAGLILAALLATLGGCTSPASNSAAPSPGSFAVHMNGTMNSAIGAAHP